MQSYSVIDLFCGCGGFSKGFYDVGFDVKLGLDLWSDAITTYTHNFKKAVTVNDDIANVNGEKISELIKTKDIDVIIGGPPCQGFSISGKRMLDDPRNRLYKSFVEIVKFFQPSIFVMENVPGLVRLFNGKVKNEVIRDFSEIGYNVEVELLSADNYGVPQQRKRIFFVGINKKKIKNTKQFIFPAAKLSDEEKITCKQAISDLDFLPEDVIGENEIDYLVNAESDYQAFMRKNAKKLMNHVITLHKEKTREIIKMVPDGSNYKSLPKDLWSLRKVNIAWTRMNSQKPCFTIDTGHNHHFHYRANRVPTVRESARIQSFPDNFVFSGIKTSQLKQVGNAVPPLLAQAIADEIKSVLERG